MTHDGVLLEVRKAMATGEGLMDAMNKLDALIAAVPDDLGEDIRHMEQCISDGKLEYECAAILKR